MFSSQEKKVVMWGGRDVSLIMVIIAQYTHESHHHVINLKLAQYHMSIISQ